MSCLFLGRFFCPLKLFSRYDQQYFRRKNNSLGTTYEALKALAVAVGASLGGDCVGMPFSVSILCYILVSFDDFF